MDTARRTPATGDLPEEQALYRQFVEATQESVRLEAALKGFYLKTDMDPAHRDAFGTYLKQRIRPAAAALIEQEDTDKLNRMAKLGWMDGHLIDVFLQIAHTSLCSVPTHS